MKKLAVAIGLLAICCYSHPAFAQATCPANFTCGFNVAVERGIVGGPVDAEPAISVGTFSFDPSGNPTVTTASNNNGQPPVITKTVSGTCASLGGSLLQMDFSASGGAKIDFVVTDSGKTLRFMQLPDSTKKVTDGTCDQL